MNYIRLSQVVKILESDPIYGNKILSGLMAAKAIKLYEDEHGVRVDPGYLTIIGKDNYDDRNLFKVAEQNSPVAILLYSWMAIGLKIYLHGGQAFKNGFEETDKINFWFNEMRVEEETFKGFLRCKNLPLPKQLYPSEQDNTENVYQSFNHNPLFETVIQLDEIEACIRDIHQHAMLARQVAPSVNMHEQAGQDAAEQEKGTIQSGGAQDDQVAEADRQPQAKTATARVVIHTKPDISWRNISITLVTREYISISIPGEQERRQYRFAELGFCDRRQASIQPNKAWILLQAMAFRRGEIDPEAAQSMKWSGDLKKDISVLRKAMQAIFPDITCDPVIFRQGSKYRTAFSLCADPRFVQEYTEDLGDCPEQDGISEAFLEEIEDRAYSGRVDRRNKS